LRLCNALFQFLQFLRPLLHILRKLLVHSHRVLAPKAQHPLAKHPRHPPVPVLAVHKCRSVERGVAFEELEVVFACKCAAEYAAVPAELCGGVGCDDGNEIEIIAFDVEYFALGKLLGFGVGGCGGYLLYE
jgi:hypothetical protein